MSEQIEPIIINVTFRPKLPGQDVDRIKPFSDQEYIPRFDESFVEAAQELIDISVFLINLSPDPTLSPEERLERLARVVPTSEIATNYRKSVRNKLRPIKARLDQLVPGLAGQPMAQLQHLVGRVDDLVPGTLTPTEKLERIGDYRNTDIGVSPRFWQ